jgi:phosphoglycolate phosphatase
MIAPRENSMTQRRFDLIAFDWDGTLFDSTALIARCIQAACREVGTTVPSREQAAFVIGLGLRDALMHAAPDFPPERYADLAQAYRRHYFAAQHEVVLFDGTLPMLQALRTRSHLLAVATGKSRRGLDEALGTTQLHSLFDATRTADETASKPHPQMLLELMAELGVAPERTLMIGDTTHDLEMATRAGVAGLGVSYGAHDHVAFGVHAPVFVAHSTRELQDWLLEHA